MKPAAICAMLSLLASSQLAASDLYPAQIPDDERDTAQRAAKLVAQVRYDEAANLYRVIIQEHPDSLYGWFNLGVARVRQGDYAAGRTAFLHALTLAPNDEMCLADLGIVESDLGHAADAVKYLLAAIKQQPNDPTTHEYLSQAYEQLGRHAEAGAEEAKATELRKGKGMFQLQDVELDDKTRHSS